MRTDRGETTLKPIVSAMMVQINVPKVQEQGCAAIVNLTLNNGANYVSIVTKHGIEAVVSAMTAHSNILEVHECGCLVLFNLSFNESVAVRIQLEGGVAVLEQNSNDFYAKRALQRIKASIILG
jgi:hypothetical protein